MLRNPKQRMREGEQGTQRRRRAQGGSRQHARRPTLSGAGGACPQGSRGERSHEFRLIDRANVLNPQDTEEKDTSTAAVMDCSIGADGGGAGASEMYLSAHRLLLMAHDGVARAERRVATMAGDSGELRATGCGG